MTELDLEKIAERVTAIREKLPEEGNDWQRMPKVHSALTTKERHLFEFEGRYNYEITTFYGWEGEITSLKICPDNFYLYFSMTRICPPWGERRVNRKIHGNYMGRPLESKQHEWYRQTEHAPEIVDRLLELTEKTIDAYLVDGGREE